MAAADGAGRSGATRAKSAVRGFAAGRFSTTCGAAWWNRRIVCFVLLGWTGLPGRAAHWTIATIVILFLPAIVQIGDTILFSAAALGKKSIFSGAYEWLVNATVTNGLMITFLAHQALLSLDAVVRTMVRRFITRQRLLQWETAAEAELAGEKRTMLDMYLNWTPVLALVILVLVGFARRRDSTGGAAGSRLVGFSKPISAWMNLPPRAPRKEISERIDGCCELPALRTWRYFAEFSTEEHIG